MKLVDPNSLRSASTARTYPVQAEMLTRAIEGAIKELPGWSLEGSTGTEIRASRKTRLGLVEDVTIRLTPSPAGAHTNTHVVFHSASRISVWDLGQNKRNLRKLLGAVDQELDTKAKQPASPEGAPNKQTRPRRSSSSAWFATSVCQTEL